MTDAVNQGWVSPEGHWLPRQLVLPDVHDFNDLFEYIADWDYETMNPRNGQLPPSRPQPVKYEGNEVGPFCSVDLRQLNLPSKHLAVRAKQITLEALHHRLFSGDTISFRLIGHERSGRVLVLAQHSNILADHWLAYIDPATIPSVPTLCRHCGRHVVKDDEGRWVDPEADGDDAIWRETCDAHDTFTAEHEVTA